MTLYDCLEEYMNLTLNLIERIKSQENVEELLKKRSDVIKRIENINFNEEEFKLIMDNLNILELENEAQKLIKAEKVIIKNQINILKKNRAARKQYIKSQENPTYFSAKI